MEVVIHNKEQLPYVAILVSPRRIEKVFLGGDKEGREKSLSILRKISSHLDDINIALERKKNWRKEAREAK